MKSSHTNWAGNLHYGASEVTNPNSAEEIRASVAKASKAKAFGSRHCFNDIADTSGIHLSTANYNKIISLDKENQTVTIESGTRYGELGTFLHENGFALPNLASLPHISVIGACVTATHGSGVENGNLATSVCALELIDGNGETRTFSEADDPETFQGVVVNLGALGIVTQLTLKIEPTFQVRQDLYENLPLSTVCKNFDTIVSSAYSVSLFTDWKSENFHQIWQKRKIDPSSTFKPEPSYFGAKRASENQHPLPGHSAECCTEQLGIPGAWHERLPHFRLEFTPSSGEELQTEYFVDRKHGVVVLNALFAIRDKIEPLVFVTEIRTVAADELWLSPNYQRDSMAIHFTWQQKTKEVLALLPKVEAILAPFEARPHWGKLFTMSADAIRKLYPKFYDFEALRKHLDPNQKFSNDYLDRYFQ